MGKLRLPLGVILSFGASGVSCCRVASVALGASVLLGSSRDASMGTQGVLGNDGSQATKGTRWMFWRQEAMKDVAWLRKSSGSCRASCDPEVSEWGNPAR